MERYFGERTPKLGFGLMRLPKKENGEIDLEQVKEMVDLFLAAGQTYFDTAYVYDGGKSEEAARKALVERYDRSSFTLCTKLNAWMGATDSFTQAWNAPARAISIIICCTPCSLQIIICMMTGTFGTL